MAITPGVAHAVGTEPSGTTDSALCWLPEPRPGLTVAVEKPGLLPPRLTEVGGTEDGAVSTSNHRRPADVWVASWGVHGPAAFDLAVTCALRPGTLPTALQLGRATADYEARRGDEKKGQEKGVKGDKETEKAKAKEPKGANAQGAQGSKDEAGGAQGASGATSWQDAGEKGPCVFYPKGLCRRGDECPYKHVGPAPKAKPVLVPKAKAGLVALLTAASVMGGVATAASTSSASRSCELEWALDSGAGGNLSSLKAFAKQGVPDDVLREFETCSLFPLTFDTGGGPKDTNHTIGLSGSKFGDELVYLLKSCLFVKSLGKMVEKGFGFLWGKDYEPTLVPPGEHVAVKCNVEKCFVASRVDHGVPISVDEVLDVETFDVDVF